MEGGKTHAGAASHALGAVRRYWTHLRRCRAGRSVDERQPAERRLRHHPGPAGRDRGAGPGDLVDPAPPRPDARDRVRRADRRADAVARRADAGHRRCAGNCGRACSRTAPSSTCCSSASRAARAARCTSRPSCGRTASSASAWPTRSCERARAGVHGARAARRQRLARRWARPRRARSCGRPAARLEFFHQRALRNIGVLNDRDHRKLVVIDGRDGASSAAIASSTAGWATPQDSEHFADVSVRLRGPIVHSVQSAFSENWVGETGELFVGDDVFPALEPRGRRRRCTSPTSSRKARRRR